MACTCTSRSPSGSWRHKQHAHGWMWCGAGSSRTQSPTRTTPFETCASARLGTSGGSLSRHCAYRCPCGMVRALRALVYVPRAILRLASAEPSFRDDWLKQLDRVTRRVLEQDLLATHPGDDVVAETRARLAQTLDHRLNIRDFDGEAVPAARLWPPAIGHGLRATARGAGPTRCTQHQAQVAARQHGEHRRRV